MYSSGWQGSTKRFLRGIEGDPVANSDTATLTLYSRVPFRDSR